MRLFHYSIPAPFTLWGLNALAGMNANTSFKGQSSFLMPEVVFEINNGSFTTGSGSW